MFLVSHHGLSRNIYNVANLCDEHNIKGFSPLFDADRFSSDEYQKGGVPTGRRTCAVERRLVSNIRASRGDAREPCVLYGHSAGGQYLCRAAAYEPAAFVHRYVVANPSTWVMPDSRAAPYGFGTLYSGTAQDDAIRAYLQLPMTVYVGENDNDPNDPDLDTSTDASAQGAHRLERAQNCFSLGQTAASNLGVTLAWSLVIAPGVGHAGTSMLNASNRNAAFDLSA